LTDNALGCRALSCRRNHYPVAHNSGRRRRMPSLNVAVHFCRHLGLRFQTVLDYWFVYNTFSLGTFRT